MTCKRFDEEGLLLLERGAALDPHYDTCPECLAARALHESIVVELGRPSPDDAVPASWEQRLRARLASEMEAAAPASAPVTPPVPMRVRPPRPQPTWSPWRWASFGALATAAASTAWLWLGPLQRGPAAPSLAWSLAAAGATRRSSEVQRDATLRFQAEPGRYAVAEIRVYRDREPVPVLACSDRPPCRREGGRIVADLTIDAFGVYQILLLVADRPLPVPGRGYDGDTAAALDAGATRIDAVPSSFEVR